MIASREKKVAKFKDLSLKEIQEYYDENLNGKTFQLTLRPHKKTETFTIDIKFFKETLPHLLGIQKVVPSYMRDSHSGEKGYNGILDGSITVQSLINFDAQRKEKKIPSIQDKVRYFHLIDELFTKCNVIKFSADKINSTLKSEFILYRDDLGVRLHLAVKKEQSNKNVYIPESFIVKNLRRKDINLYTNCPPHQYMNVVSCIKI